MVCAEVSIKTAEEAARYVQACEFWKSTYHPSTRGTLLPEQVRWMAAKRPFAELDLTQEERPTPDTLRRSSYPTASNPLDAAERHVQQSIATSRSARTLPLPSPTWFSPVNTFPSPQVPPPSWDSPGPQRRQQPSPQQQLFIGIPSSNAPHGAQVDYGSLIKKDPCSPPSGLDSDDTAQVFNESAHPENERRRLKAEIGLLQAQTEDLHRQLDLFKQHAARKDTQYLQIIEQSRRREAQGLNDSQKWQEDREQWAEERQMLQSTIKGLTTKLGELRTTYPQHGDDDDNEEVSSSEKQPPSLHLPTSLTTSDPAVTIRTTASSSAHQPSHSSTERRRQPLPSGSAGSATISPLDTLQLEYGQLAEYSARLVEIGQNIRRQLDRMREDADRGAASR